MGAHYICDYCSEPIDSRHDQANLIIIGGCGGNRVYHTTTCLPLVVEALDAASAALLIPGGGRPRTRQEAARDELENDRREWAERRARWTSLSLAQREHLLIELLGEQRFAVSELVDKVNERFGECVARYSDVYVALKGMHTAGEVARESEPFRGTRTRHQYFRKAMSGTIVELERTFHEAAPGDAAGGTS